MDYKIIKERRVLLGLTQQDLSDYTGLSVRFIKSIEAGKGNPSIETLSKMTEVALRAFAICCTAALYKELTTWADNSQVENME